MKKVNINTAHFSTYQTIKQKYPDAIVLLRIADNYTTFKNDAGILHEVTGKSLHTIQDIGNTCNFPFAELDSILNKLVKAGNKVALCDQLE
jgi:DNA mismatch repair protein MutS